MGSIGATQALAGARTVTSASRLRADRSLARVVERTLPDQPTGRSRICRQFCPRRDLRPTARVGADTPRERGTKTARRPSHGRDQATQLAFFQRIEPEREQGLVEQREIERRFVEVIGEQPNEQGHVSVTLAQVDAEQVDAESTFIVEVGRPQGTNAQTDSRSTIGTIAEKAKGPALAGGAALLGVAGGVAMTRKRKRSNVLGRIPTPKLKAPSLPKPDAVVKAVSQAAGQVADGSHRVGEVAAQVQRASEAINGSRSGSDD